ncbi:MAG: hypothetical protein U5Q44_13610 [Dehalococcoidia bacterium]|nr:hypothetical protein [Dehalococcoidia bacterium]
MCEAAVALRNLAAQRGWPVLGEAFLRMSSPGAATLHLPIRWDDASPCHDIQLGRVDYGPVVAAIAVTLPDVADVATAMLGELGAAHVRPGRAEFHFDPSVGRADGLLVIPVAQHPTDKAACVTRTRGAVAG